MASSSYLVATVSQGPTLFYMHDWVLVTGAAHRLGREMALAFARGGWSVLCHYQRSEAAAQDLVRELQNLGVSAAAVGGALDSGEAVAQLFEQAQAHAGPSLRCIVNNASLFEPDSGHDFSDDLALQQLRVNLLAPMHMGQHLARLHAHSPAGQASVVHVLDQKVFNLNPDYFSYTLSKLGLERAVRLQAQSLAPQIRVNAVAPGLMYISGPQTQANFDMAAQVNLLRRPIDPKDVAQAALFLANTPSITGTCIQVDNGQHLVPMARDVLFVVDELLKTKS
jgi:NAD(P)-dependent dehydrogenase (short-subunit alcohol dehydrogenase family)